MKNKKSSKEISNVLFFENVLIKFIFTLENVRDKVLPFLVPELFEDHKNVQLVKSIIKMFKKFERFPTVPEMRIEIDNEDIYKRLIEIMEIDVSEYQSDFLLEEIEEFIREKLIHNINVDIAMNLTNNKFDEIKKSPDKLREAISFSFDSKIGLDFLEEEERLFNFLHDKDRVVQTGIKELDRIIEGGWHEKSLSLFLAECVSENTPVDIRLKWINGYVYKNGIQIKKVKELLKNNIIEVSSPDGYVKVNEYVEKGLKKLYEIRVNGRFLNVSKYHFVETDGGWKTVSELIDYPNIYKILTDDGNYYPYEIKELWFESKVVDLSVDHKNHRYYTNSISSHNTNMGKSLIMTSLAVDCVLKNKNVLYVSCEMSENKISERIMSNMFDVNTEDLKLLTKDKFHFKFENVKKQVNNKLIVKEYPPTSINANHIRNLLKELKVRKKFTPDIIFIDYIGIMNPVHKNKVDNTYLEVKRISEEVRAVAVEMALPIVSAVQTNRKGFGGADIDLTNISDSIGTAATADVIIGVTQSNDLRNVGKYHWIVLKNRYGLNKKSINVCVDYYKMRIFEDDDTKVENTADSLSKEPPNEKEKRNKVNKAIKDAKEVVNKDTKDKFRKIINFE